MMATRRSRPHLSRQRSRRRIPKLDVLESRLLLAGEVLISELVADNVTGLTDEDNDASAWVEVYNSSNTVQDLSGWHLSDDAADRDKWTFPAGTTMQPHEFLIVFASSKDRATAGGELHANFELDESGGFLGLFNALQGLEHKYLQYPPLSPDTSYGIELPAPPAPTETTLAPRYDLWLRESSPDTVFENDALWVASSAAVGENRWTVAEWDLSGVSDEIVGAHMEFNPRSRADGDAVQEAMSIDHGIAGLTYNDYLASKQAGETALEGLGHITLPPGGSPLGSYAAGDAASDQDLTLLNTLRTTSETLTVSFKSANNAVEWNDGANDGGPGYQSDLPIQLVLETVSDAGQPLDPSDLRYFVDPSPSAFNVGGVTVLTNGVYITEFVAQNTKGVQDEDGDYSDWIEIYNADSEPREIGGWHLTNDAANPTNWTLPPGTTLGPGEFLTVFASGKDRAAAGSELHTNFELNDAGGYLALVSDRLAVKHEYASYPALAADVSYGIEMPEPPSTNFVTLAPTYDLWLRESSPDTVFENDALWVANSAVFGENRWTVAEWDLSGVTSEIVSANLEFNPRTRADGDAVQVAYTIDHGIAGLTYNDYLATKAASESPLEGLGGITLPPGGLPLGSYATGDSATAADLARLNTLRSTTSTLTMSFKATDKAMEWNDGANAGGGGFQSDLPPQLILEVADDSPPATLDLHDLRFFTTPSADAANLDGSLFLTRGVFITELSAHNTSGLRDEDNEFSDWFELYNGDSAAHDISGWRLTDDAGNAAKWTLPAGTVIPSGGFLTVFASSKDRAVSGGELHTNFELDESGGYLALVRDSLTVQHELRFEGQAENVSFGIDMPAPPAPTVVTLAPTYDLWLRESSPDTVFENDALWVAASAAVGENRWTVAEWDLSGISESIVAAHMEFNPRSRADGNAVQVAFTIDHGIAGLTYNDYLATKLASEVPLESLGEITLPPGGLPLGLYAVGDAASSNDLATLNALRSSSGALTASFKATDNAIEWNDGANAGGGGFQNDLPIRLVVQVASDEPPAPLDLTAMRYFTTPSPSATNQDGLATLTQDVYITEFVANNQNGLVDEDGDASDWIEIFNNSNAPRDISGWSLTNDAADQTKWSFPTPTVLQPGEFLIVFASGKDRANPGGELHTGFQLDEAGGYLSLVSDAQGAGHAYSSYPRQLPDISYGLHMPAEPSLDNVSVSLAPTWDAWLRESDPDTSYENDAMWVATAAAVGENRWGVAEYDLGDMGEILAAHMEFNPRTRADGDAVQVAFSIPHGLAGITWTEYQATRLAQEQPLDSLGHIALPPAGLPFGAYAAGDSASAADLALLNDLRTSTGAFTVSLKATNNAMEWNDGSNAGGGGFAQDLPPRLAVEVAATYQPVSLELDRLLFFETTTPDAFNLDGSETAPNLSPVANAGGTYTINEGDSLTLDGLGSSDPNGDPLTFEWDLNNDGIYDEAIGASPTLSWAELSALVPAINDDGTYAIGLRVSDSQCVWATDTASLAVNNVAPTISLSGDASVAAGSIYTLNLGAITDPGADTVFDWTVNWGDGAVESFMSGGDVTHTYADAMSPVSIVVDLEDEDGVHSAAGTFALTVDAQSPIYVDASGNLNILGGDSHDRIVITRGRFGVNVRMDDLTVTDLTPTGEIIVSAGAGNDRVAVAGNVAFPVRVYGGPGNDYIAGGRQADFLFGELGNDTILGGAGDNFLDGGKGNDRLITRSDNDILVGGDGNDSLQSSGGHNLLIGGSGRDRVLAGGGGDIVIGGSTDHDEDEQMLLEIRNLWTSPTDFELRVDSLRNGSGAPQLLIGATVLADDETDFLTSTAGDDWFFRFLADKDRISLAGRVALVDTL